LQVIFLQSTRYDKHKYTIDQEIQVKVPLVP